MRRGMLLLLFLVACASNAGKTSEEPGVSMATEAVVYIAADYDAVWKKLTTAEEFASWPRRAPRRSAGRCWRRRAAP